MRTKSTIGGTPITPLWAASLSPRSWLAITISIATLRFVMRLLVLLGFRLAGRTVAGHLLFRSLVRLQGEILRLGCGVNIHTPPSALSGMSRGLITLLLWATVPKPFRASALRRRSARSWVPIPRLPCLASLFPPFLLLFLAALFLTFLTFPASVMRVMAPQYAL